MAVVTRREEKARMIISYSEFEAEAFFLKNQLNV